MIPKVNLYDEAIPWESQPFHVAARYRPLDRLLESPVVGLHYVEVEPGGRILPHARKQDELYLCLSGHGLFTRSDEETPLLPGDCVLAPAGSIQGLVNTDAEPLQLLLVVVPERSDDALALLRGLLGR